MRRSRGGRRSQGSGPGDPGTALDYVNLSAVLAYHRADLGITLGTGVSAWADQSGNGHDFAQAAGGQQPAYSPDGGPNARPCVIGNGTSHKMLNATLDLPAPGTTPTYTWAIARTDAWAVNDTIYGSPSAGAFDAGLSISLFTATPSVYAYNGTVRTPLNMAVANWFRVATTFRAGASGGDRLVVGASELLMLSVGNNDPTIGRSLFARAVASYWAGAIAEILHLNAEPSASETAALNAYVAARYGGGLT